MKNPRKQFCFRIDPVDLEELQQYSDLTGISVSQAINDSIQDYLEVVVPVKLAVLARKTARA